MPGDTLPLPLLFAQEFFCCGCIASLAVLDYAAGFFGTDSPGEGGEGVNSDLVRGGMVQTSVYNTCTYTGGVD